MEPDAQPRDDVGSLGGGDGAVNVSVAAADAWVPSCRVPVPSGCAPMSARTRPTEPIPKPRSCRCCGSSKASRRMPGVAQRARSDLWPAVRCLKVAVHPAGWAHRLPRLATPSACAKRAHPRRPQSSRVANGRGHQPADLASPACPRQHTPTSTHAVPDATDGLRTWARRSCPIRHTTVNPVRDGALPLPIAASRRATL